VETFQTMEDSYELALEDGRAKVVAADQPIAVGDALLLDDEVLLVVREAEERPRHGRARFECRLALRLRGQGRDLLDYAEELRLKFTRVREARTQ
jgi:hypothetical protein